MDEIELVETVEDDDELGRISFGMVVELEIIELVVSVGVSVEVVTAVEVVKEELEIIVLVVSITGVSVEVVGSIPSKVQYPQGG